MNLPWLEGLRSYLVTVGESHGGSGMEHGTWNMEHGTWNMEY